ncbi:Putative pyruvate, phosphate dikinase regulatory protein [Paraliobacillus sp. PM-2]|uniref:pyruvate, water dikinase regulatory protein n=1 Tax=Paraliobacillus sp. PM-2 TaxID=1462524 RepID=UPI00061C2E86|nr:pyruvate, water dikinase regulatory protein [Paraliobacillus sp. PM-2]CQR46873.1 Putative pyruvate, phosphate dikinase regulatory protein [Paraliobacillus sp. PM-2]
MKPIIYLVSDSVGETAEQVIKAALSQFIHGIEYEIIRIPYVEDVMKLEAVVEKAAKANAIIGFTLVNPILRQCMTQKSIELNVESIDIIGPMLEGMERYFQQKPKLKPGLVHQLDEAYFRRVEAIEFAVRFDDGRDPRGIEQADIILVGVSRTSKTPLSQYLALKSFKVANVPIVPEVDPPMELFQVPPHKCVGLKISSEKLNDIRKERLKSLGLKEEASYATFERISFELEYFQSVIDRIGCPVIDVSNKAVEETANIILQMQTPI